MRLTVPACISFLVALPSIGRACEVCEANQPKILRGITHGSGPDGSFDYVIVIAACVLVLFTLVYAIKFIARPGERGSNHIKRTVLNQDQHGI